MKFRTRKLIRPENLNANNTLFGGELLRWIDEESAIFAVCQLGTAKIATRHISELNFVAPARQGDIIEIGVDLVRFGTTSITLCCEVRNKDTKQTIVKIDSIVFVAMNDRGQSVPHGRTELRAD